MIKYENQCVNCELPCLGDSCPFLNVPIHYCDDCEKEYAVCTVDGKELCLDCAKALLNEEFNNLAPFEQAEVLNLDFSFLE